MNNESPFYVKICIIFKHAKNILNYLMIKQIFFSVFLFYFCFNDICLKNVNNLFL